MGRFDVIVVGHGDVLCRIGPRPSRAFVAITQTAGGTGQNPKAERRAEAQRRMAEPAILFAMQSCARQRVFRRRAAKIVGRSHCRSGAACRPIAL